MMPFCPALAEPSERGHTVGAFLTFACAARVPSRTRAHTQAHSGKIEPLHLSTFRSCKWEWRHGQLCFFFSQVKLSQQERGFAELARKAQRSRGQEFCNAISAESGSADLTDHRPGLC